MNALPFWSSCRCGWILRMFFRCLWRRPGAEGFVWWDEWRKEATVKNVQTSSALINGSFTFNGDQLPISKVCSAIWKSVFAKEKTPLIPICIKNIKIKPSFKKWWLHCYKKGYRVQLTDFFQTLTWFAFESSKRSRQINFKESAESEVSIQKWNLAPNGVIDNGSVSRKGR
jgi:hypothetical protein